MISGLRGEFTQALKDAMRAQDKSAASTLRLILAALKDRDVAARGRGIPDGIGEDEIMEMLSSMIKQRNESISLYEQGGRCELAEREREEVRLIQKFLPPQLEGEALRNAVDTVISDIGANCVKDMGRCMGTLKERYAGQMDFAKASSIVKERLAGVPC